MKAIAYSVHGGPEVLQYIDLPDPVPGSGEVVVAVRATAVNRLDLLQRQGPALLPGFTLPHVAGMDIAGEIIEVGPDVDAVKLGKRVLIKAGIPCYSCAACFEGDDRNCARPSTVGATLSGGYAERCCVPENQTFELPDAISFEEAATIPTACSTAWRSLVGTAHLAAGETIVIHGAGSGVTVMAVQIAKHIGAQVIVTSRSQTKLEKAIALGADVGVDENRDDAADLIREATGGKGADVVLNHVGPATFDLSVRSLRREGRLVICGTTTGVEVNLRLPSIYHQSLEILGAKALGRDGFVEMLDAYWQSDFQPVVDSTFPLPQAADAQVRLDSGDVFGKVVILV